jgi:Ca2+-binding RTX toxin-like protein
MSTPGIVVVGNGTELFLRGTAGDDAFSGSGVSEYFVTGLGDDDVFGGGGNDIIYADEGDDVFDGGAGVDRLIFGTVNSTLGTGAQAEIGVEFDLNKTVQTLRYFGTKEIFSIENVSGTSLADKLIGNGLNNLLEGGSGNDRLDGRGGSDELDGGFGNDTMTGGDGNDVLIGYVGRDRFYGNAGADVLYGGFEGLLDEDDARDTFVYTSRTDSGLSSATQDVIWGTFDGVYNDKIDLSALDANGSSSGNGTFRFIGDDGFHSNSTGEVQVRATANVNEYLVKIDMDTDSGSEMTLLVHSTTLLTASDFVL